MKATPRISADFDEYPEIRVLADAVIRRVVELMGIHDIVELRRIHKVGVFDRPYVKDVVTPIGLPVPSSIASSRYSVGVAILNYLETVGIQGITLEISNEDAQALSSLWNPGRVACGDSAITGESSTEKSAVGSVDPVPAREGHRDTTDNAAVNKPDTVLKENNPQEKDTVEEHAKEKKNG